MNNFRVGGQSPITFDRFIRGIIALVIIGGIFAMIYALSGVLIPFFVAWVAAYLLYPLVRQLHKRLHNRFLAIFLTISLTIAALGTFVYIVIPPMLSEITHLKDVALSYIQAGGNADGIPQPVQKLLNEHVNEYKIEQFLQHEDVVTAIKNTVPRVWELLWSTAGIIINFAASLIGLLYLLFLLTDYEKYANSWITFIPPSKRPFATRFVADVERCMAGYFRGQALIALSNCVMFSIGFALVDFPCPLPWAASLVSSVSYLICSWRRGAGGLARIAQSCRNRAKLLGLALPDCLGLHRGANIAGHHFHPTYHGAHHGPSASHHPPFAVSVGLCLRYHGPDFGFARNHAGY